jgi:hypothetical protein
VAVAVWIHIWVFYSVQLVFISGFVPVKVTNLDEDEDKLEPLGIGNRKIKMMKPGWTTVWWFLKKFNIELHRNSACNNLTSSYMNNRIGTRDLNRCLYIHIRSNIIHNSQKVETIQMPISC